VHYEEGMPKLQLKEPHEWYIVGDVLASFTSAGVIGVEPWAQYVDVHDYRGEIGKMYEWYHRTLAGGTLALDAPLTLYVIRRFLQQVESRSVGGDIYALRDAMVELVGG